jgi:putative spermidine/putrescine transport system ATP-binding protein
VQEALALVDLSGYGERLPRELSGGQQQRVALARAIVFGPSLLLLDEPFGALDRKLREQMQLEVRRLQRRLNLTAVFVTHDQEEALILSDRIAVMDAGKLSQLGSPQEIYRQPANRFVADFIGESNLFRARVVADGHAELARGQRMPMPDGAPAAGTDVGLLLRPERPRRLAGETADAVMSGRVVEIIYLGETVKYRIEDAHGVQLIVRWPYLTVARGQPIALGDALTVGWDRDDMHWIHWS